jgi:S1-C subfamily serine protease
MRTIRSTGVRLLFVLATAGAVSEIAAAELRKWSTADGQFSVDATATSLDPGDVVRLKTADGRELAVPLSQLGVADRAYVHDPKNGLVSPRLARAQRAADRCRLPDDAIVVYQVLHDDPQADTAEKQIAAVRIAELKEHAAKKLVRLNHQWVAADEAEAVRRQADELMRQGLQLLRLQNESAFRAKFQAAAALEPESIRADFLAAVVYTARHEVEKAALLFQKCLAVDPDNIAVLNNLAMLSAGKADWGAAASLWRRALAIGPDQRVVHNLGRFLEQAAVTTANVPKPLRDALALPYAEMVGSGKFQATDPEVGWLLLLIEASDLDIDFREGEQKPRDMTPAATADGPVVGGGTGFVVHPGYVLTNAHVAVDDATYEIQLADGKLLKATRAAKSDQADLALLKCEGLEAPALPLAQQMVPRGTEVMLLGYPEMTTLGASLKSNRGSISSIPAAGADDRYLYDLVTNAGNSGGPVCDARGNVVAVHYLGINTAGRYGGGIPSPTALEFVRRSIPDFQPAAPSEAKLEWPQVDEKAAPSTVLIWVRRKTARPSGSSLGTDLIELPFCLFCGGTGKLACNVTGCRNGNITRGGILAGCPSCENGIARCRVCSGAGVDLELASVQRALRELAAKKAAAKLPAAAPAPTSPPAPIAKPTPTPPPAPVAAAATAGVIAPADGTYVNLLSLIDLSKHAVHGQWTMEDGVLVGGGENASRVRIPYEPPAEYDLVIVARLVSSGNGGLLIGLVTGGRQFYVTAQQNHCGISAGGVINNRFKVDGLQTSMAKPTVICCQVRRGTIVVQYGSRTVLDYRGDLSQLRLGTSMAMPGRGEVFIGSGGPGQKWAVSSITLIGVAETPAGEAPAGAPSATPAEIVGPDGARYRFIMGQFRWTEAKKKCEELGGRLASITTPAEHAFLVQSAPKSPESPAQGKWWIGGYVENNRWNWVSGEPFVYAATPLVIDPTQPYLRLMTDSNRWSIRGDRTSLIEGFICEWPKAD